MDVDKEKTSKDMIQSIHQRYPDLRTRSHVLPIMHFNRMSQHKTIKDYPYTFSLAPDGSSAAAARNVNTGKVQLQYRADESICEGCQTENLLARFFQNMSENVSHPFFLLEDYELENYLYHLIPKEGRTLTPPKSRIKTVSNAGTKTNSNSTTNKPEEVVLSSDGAGNIAAQAVRTFEEETLAKRENVSDKTTTNPIGTISKTEEVVLSSGGAGNTFASTVKTLDGKTLAKGKAVSDGTKTNLNSTTNKTEEVVLGVGNIAAQTVKSLEEETLAKGKTVSDGSKTNPNSTSSDSKEAVLSPSESEIIAACTKTMEEKTSSEMSAAATAATATTTTTGPTATTTTTTTAATAAADGVTATVAAASAAADEDVISKTSENQGRPQGELRVSGKEKGGKAKKKKTSVVAEEDFPSLFKLLEERAKQVCPKSPFPTGFDFEDAHFRRAQYDFLILSQDHGVIIVEVKTMKDRQNVNNSVPPPITSQAGGSQASQREQGEEVDDPSLQNTQPESTATDWEQTFRKSLQKTVTGGSQASQREQGEEVDDPSPQNTQSTSTAMDWEQTIRNDLQKTVDGGSQASQREEQGQEVDDPSPGNTRPASTATDWEQAFRNDLKKTVAKAIKQLQQAGLVMGYLTSDLPSHPPPIRKVLALPYVSRGRLRHVLQSAPHLSQALCRCLEASELDEALTRCLCAEEVSGGAPLGNDATSSGGQEPEPETEPEEDRQLRWWTRMTRECRQGEGKKHSPPPRQMTWETYEQLVARFCGRYSRIEGYSVADCIHLTGVQFGRSNLRQEQLDILDSPDRFVFLTGVPGGGKTLLLGLKAVEWARTGGVVVVICPEGIQTGSLVSLQLLRRIREALGSSNNSNSSSNSSNNSHTPAMNTDPSTIKEKSQDGASWSVPLHHHHPQDPPSPDDPQGGMENEVKDKDKDVPVLKKKKVCRRKQQKKNKKPASALADNVFLEKISNQTNIEQFVSDILQKYDASERKVLIILDEMLKSVSQETQLNHLSYGLQYLQKIRDAYQGFLSAPAEEAKAGTNTEQSETKDKKYHHQKSEEEREGKEEDTKETQVNNGERKKNKSESASEQNKTDLTQLEKPERKSHTNGKHKKTQITEKSDRRSTQTQEGREVTKTPETPQEVTQTIQEVAQTPQEVTQTPQEVTQTPQEVTQTPQESTKTTQEVNQTPQEVSKTPQEVTQTTQEVTKTIQEVTQTTQEVSQTTPQEVSQNTQEVTPKPQEATQTPQEVAQTPQEVAQTPQEVPQTPQEVAQTPQEVTQAQEVALTPQEVSQTPQEVTQTPQESTQTPQEVTQTPQEVTQTPQESTQTTQEVNQTPQDVTQTPQESIQTPQEVAQTIQEVTQTPQDVTQTPQEVTQTPQEVAQTPQEATQTPEERELTQTEEDRERPLTQPQEEGQVNSNSSMRREKALTRVKDLLKTMDKRLGLMFSRLGKLTAKPGGPEVLHGPEWGRLLSEGQAVRQEVVHLREELEKKVLKGGEGLGDVVLSMEETLEKADVGMVSAMGHYYHAHANLYIFVTQSLLSLLLSRQQTLGNLAVWVSSLHTGWAPSGYEVKRLTQCLRCPPVVQEILSLTAESVKNPPQCQYAWKGSDAHFPLPADGPEVKWLDHGPHVTWSKEVNDCAHCGHALADYLLNELGILGPKDADSRGCLTLEDVVISGSPIHKSDCSFVRVLRERGIKVKYENQELTSPPPYPNTAVILGGATLLGLEAKIVVYVPEVHRISITGRDTKPVSFPSIIGNTFRSVCTTAQSASVTSAAAITTTATTSANNSAIVSTVTATTTTATSATLNTAATTACSTSGDNSVTLNAAVTTTTIITTSANNSAIVNTVGATTTTATSATLNAAATTTIITTSANNSAILNTAATSTSISTTVDTCRLSERAVVDSRSGETSSDCKNNNSSNNNSNSCSSNNDSSSSDNSKNDSNSNNNSKNDSNSNNNSNRSMESSSNNNSRSTTTTTNNNNSSSNNNNNSNGSMESINSNNNSSSTESASSSSREDTRGGGGRGGGGGTVREVPETDADRVYNLGRWNREYLWIVASRCLSHLVVFHV
ncbi:uncharacterized protein LOC143276657 [Babylonia areolata]|uniref:uncharacterized protein LOC143276657 n=1 Tax=Babylonia areolata TaxID=304850 RepID=UPI003FCEF9D2